jgi:hypothetical protein
LIPVTLKVLHAGFAGALEGDNNPDETLTLAVTMRELAVLSLGIVFAMRIVPECAETASELGMKIQEVSRAQEFLEWDGLEDWKREYEG